MFWVEQPLHPLIHIYLEPVNVTSFGNRVSIKMRSYLIRVGLTPTIRKNEEIQKTETEENTM